MFYRSHALQLTLWPPNGVIVPNSGFQLCEDDVPVCPVEHFKIGDYSHRKINFPPLLPSQFIRGVFHFYIRPLAHWKWESKAQESHNGTRLLALLYKLGMGVGVGGPGHTYSTIACSSLKETIPTR